MKEKLRSLLYSGNQEAQYSGIELLAALGNESLFKTFADDIEIDEQSGGIKSIWGMVKATDELFLRFANVLSEQFPQYMPKVSAISVSEAGDEELSCLSHLPLVSWKQGGVKPLPKALASSTTLQTISVSNIEVLPEWLSDISTLRNVEVIYTSAEWPAALESCVSLDSVSIRFSQMQAVPPLAKMDEYQPILQDLLVDAYLAYVGWNQRDAGEQRQKDILTWLLKQSDVRWLKKRRDILGYKHLCGSVQTSWYCYSSINAKKSYKWKDLCHRIQYNLLRKPIKKLEYECTHDVTLPENIHAQTQLKSIRIRIKKGYRQKILYTVTLPQKPISSVQDIELAGSIDPPKWVYAVSELNLKDAELHQIPSIEELRMLPPKNAKQICLAHMNTLSEEKIQDFFRLHVEFWEHDFSHAPIINVEQNQFESAEQIQRMREQKICAYHLSTLILRPDSPLLSALDLFDSVTSVEIYDILQPDVILSQLSGVTSLKIEAKEILDIDWTVAKPSPLDARERVISSFRVPTADDFIKIPVSRQIFLLQRYLDLPDGEAPFDLFKQLIEQNAFPKWYETWFSSGSFCTRWLDVGRIRSIVLSLLAMNKTPPTKIRTENLKIAPLIPIIPFAEELILTDGLQKNAKVLKKSKKIKSLTIFSTIEDWDVLFSLRTLRRVNLRNASWDGALPDQWNQLSELRELSMKDYSQTIPQSLLESSLERFYLCDSDLVSADFSGMNSLKKLRLVSCSSASTEIKLPSSLKELSISASPGLVHKIDFATLPNLKILRMQTCELDDLPSSLYAHTSLQQLFVSYNDLRNLQSLQCMSSLNLLAIKDIQCQITDEMLPKSLQILNHYVASYTGERFKRCKESPLPTRYATKDLDISVLSKTLQEGKKIFQRFKQQGYQ